MIDVLNAFKLNVMFSVLPEEKYYLNGSVVLNYTSSVKKKFSNMKKMKKILKTLTLSILSSDVLLGCDANTKGFLEK